MKNYLESLQNFIRNHIVKIFFALCFFLIISMFFIDYSSIGSTLFRKNFPIVSSSIITIAICLTSYFLITSYLNKKYSLKIEKLSLGGLSILFDSSRVLYIKSVTNFLDSKRTLFKIEPTYDNFSDTFESYFQTYNFFRQEMKILDPQRDKDLYILTNNILQELNKFLTKNQNNYRRWYQKVSTDNTIEYFNQGSGKYFYNTPINEIQKEYYDYDQLLTSFNHINIFFEQEVKNKFNIDTTKWDW